ncbi:ABC-type uncharacterized transport system periplasmic component-like protein (fragment) [Desulfamplus magnetovallimortis]|uniref:ABC-type uncharacterized transport system periplasmic component-like protein n=1 Tax=Desulfamplus magnetovallimortis TaxID=1246637 RepID=A0A1W1HFV9_9BACT
MKILKSFTLFFALCFIAVTTISAEESSQKQSTLLIIDSQESEPYSSVREAMLLELSSLGYIEGKNLKTKYYSLGNYDGRSKSIWNVLEKKNSYDVIFLNGTIAVASFKELALDDQNKFVFASITDPVGVGVIEDFQNPPKHNFTGICYPVKVEDRLKFIQKVLPTAKTIGLIHADMPQSQSYKNWIEETLKKPEFQTLKVIFRDVEFVKSDGGHKRMTMLAKKHVEELDSQVDVFLSPNDQMGVTVGCRTSLYLISIVSLHFVPIDFLKKYGILL